MIYDELRGYLSQAVDSGDLQLFDDGFALLETFEVDDYMTPFETIVGEVSDTGDTAVVDRVRLTLLTLLRNIISLHGITLVDDVALAPVILICRSLIATSTFEDTASIRQQVQEHNENNEALLADVFALVMGQASEDFIIHFASVEHNLIKSLGKLGAVENQDDEDEVSADFEAIVRAYMADYQKVRNAVNAPTLWSDNLLHHLSAIGQPFALHLKYFLQDAADMVANCQAIVQYEQLAGELLGIAALSQEKLPQALQCVRANASEIYTDLDRTSKLDQALTKLFVEVNRAQA